MPAPSLNLPKALGSRSAWLPVGIILRQIRKWADSTANLPHRELVDQCLYKLIKLNATKHSVKSRLQILEAIQLSLLKLFRNQKQIIRSALNVDDAELNNLHQLDKLFAEFANGYKLIIHTLSEKQSLSESESQHIQEAIYYGLKFMAHRLLLAYVQYATPAKGIWREINQIYRYAEESELLYHIIDDPVSDSRFPVFHSADFVYKRILLLCLTEPYRLMKDECLEIYNLCSRWVGACSLFPIRELASQGEHVVDLADDLPPRYVTRDLHWQPLSGRLIDISEIVSRIEKDLDQLLKDQSANDSGLELLDLDERQKRDMLLRVLSSFRGKPARQSKRFVLSDNISFVMGINNCHFYLSNKRQMSPYMDELKLTTSRIHHENPDAGNFASLYKLALEKDRSFKWHEQDIQTALQHNINPMGLAFSYEIPRYQRRQHLSVGEIIAYRSTNRAASRWVIGAANWIKRKTISEDNIIYDIGIRNIARNAISVTTRVFSEKGLDYPYYRALLIPRHVSHQQLRSLIVPALCFDINDVVYMNMGRTIRKIKLTRLLGSSNAYTQFEFEML